MSTTIEKNASTSPYVYIRQVSTNSLIEYSTDNSIWSAIIFPVTIKNTNPSSSSILTVRFETDLFISSNKYFAVRSDYITIDGNNKKVTFNNVSNYKGLIENGTPVSYGYNNINVKNIYTKDAGSSTLVNGGGWICQSNFGKHSLNNKIENCSNECPVNNDNCGGICGGMAGVNMGSVSLTNCYNTGIVSGVSAGGICGQQAGINNGNVSLNNCYNTGIVSGGSAGGICGNMACINNGAVSLTNCYNTGSISGSDAGGLCGTGCGNNGAVSLTNCYNTGIVSGVSAGGICGQQAGINNGNVSLNNCYNTGIVSGGSAGGICGNMACINNGAVSLTNCYNTGSISGSDAGGLCGTLAGLNGGTCSLTNCYTLYGLLARSIQPGFSSSKCYLASGSWSDINANAALVDGVPTLGNIFGLTWVSVSPGTPYLLKSYNKEVYSINSVVASESPFISESGLFQSPFKYEMLGVNDNNSISSSDFTIDENSGVITFGSTITTGIYKIDVFVYNNSNEINGVKIYDGYNFNSLTVDAEVVPLSNICFLGNTLITTDQGECRIDEIDVKYHTLDGKSILKITKSLSVDNYLVRFGKGSLGLNVPSRCTLMTPNHSLLYNGELIEARNFLNGFDNVSKLSYRGEIVYNVLMNVAGTMKVNNLICETLNPCNGMARLLVYLDRLNLSDRNDLLLCYNDYFKVNKCFPKSLCYKKGRHFLR